MGIVYLNGEFVPVSAAMVAADDAGLLRGEGLFETMRAAYGRVFRVELHEARLRRSAAALGIELPRGGLDLAAVTSRLLAENHLREGRCRLTLTAGGTCLAMAEPVEPYDAELYRLGAAVTLSESRVDEHSAVAGHKVTSYFGNIVELRRVRERGLVDALRFNVAGHLAEGCVSNVFLVIDGRLYTPGLSSGCLPGVTRQVVLELARLAGVEFEEREIGREELRGAEEVFLTNTLMGIMPVGRIDDTVVGQGEPGAVTGKLGDMYRRMVLRYCGGGMIVKG